MPTCTQNQTSFLLAQRDKHPKRRFPRERHRPRLCYSAMLTLSLASRELLRTSATSNIFHRVLYDMFKNLHAFPPLRFTPFQILALSMFYASTHDSSTRRRRSPTFCVTLPCAIIHMRRVQLTTQLLGVYPPKVVAKCFLRADLDSTTSTSTSA